MSVLGRPPVVIGALAVLVLVVATVLAGEPVLLVTLLPTALMLLAKPAAPASGAVNAFCGHLIAVCSGYLATGMFGLLYSHAGFADQGLRRLLAMVFALVVTVVLMLWGGVPHPPALVSTLAVSYGSLTGLRQLAILLATVLVLSGLRLLAPGITRLLTRPDVPDDATRERMRKALADKQR
jgi:hypothetical protein